MIIENKKARVLAVDDEYPNLFLMHDLLASKGFQVSLANDGEEALESVLRFPPDVILLDINMPKMDGFEVLERLKKGEATQFIPVVMVTGQSEVEDRVKALELGADDFLIKPVDWMELTARVQSLVKVKAYYDYMHDHQRHLEAEVNQRTEQLRLAADKLRRAHEGLKASSLDTIYRLSRAAEYRDEDTGAHIQRMSHFAAAVARKMGLNERIVEGILYGAPMHDVGKIGIPDRILLKPGKLDSDEWEVMKQHTTIGARILEGASVGFIKMGEIIALTHHEKWDGTGYPRGLKGKETPLIGRITAIGDVFDALTSQRPYKEAFSVEKSLEIVKAGRGSHFDPDVVDAFLAILEEILEIKEKYRDNQNGHPRDLLSGLMQGEYTSGRLG